MYSLNQGTKSVDEYFKKMKLAMIQANVEEDNKATMAKFMNELNHIMKLHHYMELEEMVHMAMKVEKQLK